MMNPSPWSPIIFERPEDEKENLRALARGMFHYVARQRTSPPSVEEVFPALSALIQQNGNSLSSPIAFLDAPSREQSELERLDAYVSQGFDLSPHLMRPMLTRDQGMAGQWPSNPSRPLPPPQAQPSPAPAIPEACPPTLYTPVDRSSVPTGATKDRAYAVTHALLGQINIKILGEAIYSYTGTHYAHMSGENLRRLIMAVCRDDVASEGNARLVDAIYKLLLCEPKICDKPESIDTHLVSFQNGVLNLHNGQLYRHAPSFNTYYELQANYTPGLAHPVFDRFIASITGNDPMLRQRILEIIGYCLVPDVKAKVFFVFQGAPDSGKSVLASFIRHCLNQEASVATDVLSLGDRFTASSLIGKQLCTSMDLPSTPLNPRTVSVFKMITGGDPLTADVKYRPPITFLNRAKFILGTNHPLLTQGDDPAFYRRVVVVPFLNSIPRQDQDHFLLEKLNAERSAIIASALQAYQELRHRNYQFSGEFQLNGGLVRKPEQRGENEILQEFIQHCCAVDHNAAEFVHCLYEQFCCEYPFLHIPLLSFSSKLLDVCQSLGLDVRKGQKKRMAPHENPRAILEGICLLAHSHKQQLTQNREENHG